MSQDDVREHFGLDVNSDDDSAETNNIEEEHIFFNDLMIAQLAIVTQGNLLDAMTRCKDLNEVRRKFNIQTSKEAQARAIEWAERTIPGFHLVRFSFFYFSFFLSFFFLFSLSLFSLFSHSSLLFLHLSLSLTLSHSSLSLQACHPDSIGNVVNLTHPVQRKISVLRTPEDWSLYMTAWFTKLLALSKW